jgi:CubicO group peptidase (beta-lactamase class C family)
MTANDQPIEELQARLGQVASPGASMALIADGAVSWIGSHGQARVSSQRPVDERTAFLWFSMTKIATATAVMQLVDSGEISIDAAVRERLPDLESLDARITVRQLLNHSSGIPNPPPLRWIHPADETGPDPRQLVARLLDRYGKPKFDPGDHSAYTNIGYLVLGELITEVSGRPYKDVVVDRVLRPIGANATGFTFEAAGFDHAAEGTHPRFDPFLPIARLLIPRWVIGPPVGRWRTFNPFYLDGSAYGGLVGPVSDAARLAAAHLGGGAFDGTRILSEESATEMQRISTPGKKFDLGLGGFRTHRDSKRGLTHIEHLGGGAAYGAVMRLYPGRGLGAVGMVNASSNRFKHEALLAPLSATT